MRIGKNAAHRHPMTRFLSIVLAMCSGLVTTAVAGDGDKEVYFGDLHLHTRYSNDAFFLTTESGLGDAYITPKVKR